MLQITLFKGVTDTKGQPVSFSTVLSMIKEDAQIEKQISRLRSAHPDKKEDVKKKLPAVTWSAEMDGKGRSSANVAHYSGLICLDIDKLSPEDLAAKWETIIADPFTYFSFISPSGNGIKIIVRVPLFSAGHLEYFKGLEKHFAAKGITIDPSGKDINRLCFLSYDYQCYLNENSTTYELQEPAQLKVEKPKAFTPAERKEYDNLSPDLDAIYKFTENKLTYTDGQRNNFVHLFAANCNRKGVDISECLTHVSSFAHDLKTNEVAATVQSAYKQNAHEHGKFAKRQGGATKAAKQQRTTNGQLPQPNLQFEDEPYTQFWFETVTEDKNGKEKRTLELSYRLLIQFLSENGYYRLAVSETGYELVHYSTNIVKRVQAYQIRDFVVKWATERNMWTLEEKLRRAGKTALSNDQINTLPFVEIDFKKDTHDEAFFYFKNCWVLVNKQGITTHEYSALDKAIWATQIKPREFKKLENWVINIDDPESFTCEYARFLCLTSHNTKGEESNDIKYRMDRFDSFCTSFGYLLHSFKNPSNAKMILSIDHKLGEKGEQNGGSGKSLAGKAVAELKHTTHISGKDFKEDYPFKYEQVTPDSQLVSFNDLRRNFNMECLFEIITGDFTVNRRNVGYLVLPFETSPKVYANTNFIPPGEGSSFIRRMHVLEFSDYFTEEYTPFDEFGHTLFQDWNEDEWNRFYNFMLQNCVSLYLQKGLVKYPGSNFDQRKLQSEVPEEFIDFLDQKSVDGKYIVTRNVCHRKVDLLDRFRDFTKGTGLKDPTANSFTRWMKKYCKTKGCSWNKHMGGKRDSSGPLGEFVSICDDLFDQDACIASRGTLFHQPKQ